MSQASPAFSARRRFLKLSLIGGALLAGASTAFHVANTGPAARATGFNVLREADLPFLKALIPVILAGATPREQLPQIIEPVLQRLDGTLAHVSPAALALLQQLLDVTASSATRGPLTGVWQPWEDASGEEVSAFLQRWRDSPIGLLRQGHAALTQAIFMAWYDNPAAWLSCGYPGPPAPFNGVT